MTDTAGGGSRTATATLLHARDVHVAYADEVVLDDVGLALEPGHCLALAGANGSGKSTLLRVCVGRQQPDRGEVAFAGAPPREADPAFRREVGLLLDGAECFPDLTVAEHVRMVATAHGLGSDAGPAADRVLAGLGLEHRGDAFPEALSAGQRQMLLLASVLVRPARLIVVDEPEQRLDTAARRRLAAALRTAKEAGTAVLLASHDRATVEEVADRVLLLDRGRVAALGAPAEVTGAAEVSPWR
ncbi:ATP-binding cassette domain-containing protein [Streptomyces sp. WAC06614]|uniref:ATP-binding cassette domain-containing protein n=1 Tax=Streptomyces sp. WAC06614 TaxID=2487416 RepID=UPI0021AE879C|nr:ABC transporter ATP-binding protein [Streptomyces sp. WAC06614]